MFFGRKLSVSIFVLFFIVCLSMPLYAVADGKININIAGVEELASLDKVGDKYAQRIVEYREKNGMFEKAEDIVNVKGIGSKIWEANKDRIVVE